MANFIGLVYATLKNEGIDTKGMSTDEAVKKYNELQEKSGGKAGEKEGTPAENRKLDNDGTAKLGDKDYKVDLPTKQKEWEKLHEKVTKNRYAVKKAEELIENSDIDFSDMMGESDNDWSRVFFENKPDKEYEKAKELLDKNNYKYEEKVNKRNGAKYLEITGKKENKDIGIRDDIDYDNVTYPKGTSKEYTMMVNDKYRNAIYRLKGAGIDIKDFKYKPAKEGGIITNTAGIMQKYVFEPFNKKYPKGNNGAWERDYKPLYDAIEAVDDKVYNDWWILNK